MKADKPNTCCVIFAPRKRNSDVVFLEVVYDHRQGVFVERILAEAVAQEVDVSIYMKAKPKRAKGKGLKRMVFVYEPRRKNKVNTN